MRPTLPLALLLAACSGQSEQKPAQRQAGTGTFAGEGRDRYCIKRSGDDWRVGIVTYGPGNMNCTLKGKVVEALNHDSLVEATGDKACRFQVTAEGDSLRLPQKLPAACDYYCGPGASLSGKTFKLDPSASPTVDFAGDPLC